MKRMRPLLALALLACNGGGTDRTGGGPAASVRLVEVASGLSSPLYLTAPSGDPRLFVVEQPGRIRVIKNGALLPTPFLDVTAKVTSGGERGLLSVAFHPQYASNGLLYVNYTDRNGDTRVERYHVSADADRADPASAHLVLAVAQPYANHNGGLVMFGPDGKLYVGMGDGGSGGDPLGNGQNLSTLLGKLLRLDVDAADPYAVPAGNPFAGQAGRRGEIWALGLRNPWRFSFDRDSGLLFVADVGQDAWEEVNVVPASAAGLNYGWKTMEATHCYSPSTGCATGGLVLPVLEYSHADGCSITGGFVYRGSALPALKGTYFYSDYCEGFIRSFRFSGGAAAEQKEWSLGDTGQVLSFGLDAAGELYVMTADGRVLRFSA
jgi:glucose/arabinose dehydrogenase